MVIAVVLSLIIGFMVGWLVHTILASMEFDRLLWKTEKDKQELIDQFNRILTEKEEAE